MKAVNNNFNIPELLSPAGEPDSFFGAINAGADAIYLAGEKFGARAYATNFNTDTLVNCIYYAHLMHKKVYLTVNTLFKENETEQLLAYILPFYEAGLDACIVQDLGALRILKTAFPDMEIHISTQMTICSQYGANLLKEMGASRIVPARELSLNEIQQIKRNVNIELETFIHGAMCYCYSGQCLFSSILGGRSGNRGRCAQPCRLPYQIRENHAISREMYPLSLKDMCTIEHLPQLIESGIDSFKIEGRMKKPEYAAGVTDVYRRAMDRYFELRTMHGAEEAAHRYTCDSSDQKILSSLYIRSEVQDGYYFKHNGKEMITLESPSYAGGDEQLLASIQQSFLHTKKRLPVEINAKFSVGAPAKLSIRCEDAEIHVEGAVVEQAKNAPLTEENIKKQLLKLGDTSFFSEHISIQMDDTIFFSLKALNELRRDACDRLLVALTQKQRRIAPDFMLQPSFETDGISSILKISHKNNDCKISEEPMYSILVSNLLQLQEVHRYLQKNSRQVSRVYIEIDCFFDKSAEMTESILTLKKYTEIWIALPYIFRNKTEQEMEQLLLLHEAIHFDGVLVRSMDEFGFLKNHPFQKLPLRADAGVYTWNFAATQELSEICQRFTIPYELNSKEQGILLNKANASSYEKIVYGRIPMMVTANCVMRTSKGCNKDNHATLHLVDRYKKEFPVVRNCGQCYNVIYNSVPLRLSLETQGNSQFKELRLQFTIEDADTTANVLEYYLGEESTSNHFSQEYTTGHEKRGVE